jgi:hypothetical protein
MTRLLLLGAFAMTGLFSTAQTGKVISDPHAEKREAKGFHAIRVSGGIDLYLTQGADEAVAVSASSNETRDRIKTVVEDGVLKIYMDNEGHHWGHIGGDKLKAYVSVRELNALHASGGSDVYIEDMIKAKELKVELSGGSDLKGKVDIGVLSIQQSGGADVFINGSVGSLAVHASGGSDLHGYDLASETCNVVSSGGSDVQITVNKELSVIASGGSDVYYKGACTVKQLSSSGSSDVIKKG